MARWFSRIKFCIGTLTSSVPSWELWRDQVLKTVFLTFLCALWHECTHTQQHTTAQSINWSDMQRPTYSKFFPLSFVSPQRRKGNHFLFVFNKQLPRRLRRPLGNTAYCWSSLRMTEDNGMLAYDSLLSPMHKPASPLPHLIVTHLSSILNDLPTQGGKGEVHLQCSTPGRLGQQGERMWV